MSIVYKYNKYIFTFLMFGTRSRNIFTQLRYLFVKWRVWSRISRKTLGSWILNMLHAACIVYLYTMWCMQLFVVSRFTFMNCNAIFCLVYCLAFLYNVVDYWHRKNTFSHTFGCRQTPSQANLLGIHKEMESIYMPNSCCFLPHRYHHTTFSLLIANWRGKIPASKTKKQTLK